MSVTIMPGQNMSYCDEHNLVNYTEYDCQTCSFEGVKETCSECSTYPGPAGKVRFPDYPYELNVANGNFRTLWASLALEPGEYLSGFMPPATLRQALDNFDPALMERATTIEEGSTGIRLINCGVTLDQANYYYHRLLEIVTEAERRGVDIVWG